MLKNPDKVRVADGGRIGVLAGRDRADRIRVHGIHDFHDLGRSVATTGVGDALVAAKFVRPINKAAHTLASCRFGLVPEVVDVLEPQK